MSNNESTVMLEYLNALKNQKKGLSRMTMSKIFKQFFTPQKYSQIMIKNLDIDEPKTILDLSMGEASLLIEAMKIWQNSAFIGNDIDINCCNKVQSDCPKIKCFNENVFEQKTIQKIIQENGKVDLCLANPPFHLIPQSEDIREILREYNFDNEYQSDYIPAEVVFILQCLSILKNGGTLSIILPDGFFSNTYLEKFRSFLLNKYKIEKVIELPSNIFKKTDAKTHILILKNEIFNNTKLLLESIGNKKKLIISKNKAIKRMDYSYHFFLTKSFKSSIEISDETLGIEFVRGKVKYLIEDIEDKHILHTTNFSQGNVFVNRLKTPTKLLKYKEKIAIPGDIVIARVGSYCVGKIGIVESGYFVATDCIFLVRIKDEDLREKVLIQLKSEQGQAWIKANLKGVSAKHITFEDFKKFPFIVGDE